MTPEAEKQLAWLLVYIMSSDFLSPHGILYTTRLSHLHDSFLIILPMSLPLIILDRCNAVC